MKVTFVITLMVLSANSWCQSDSTQTIEVRRVIDQLFDGMRSGDSSMVRAVLHSEVRMMSTYQKEGEYHVHTGSVTGFLDAIGTPHDEIWDERISNVIIQIDAGLAQVWMDYTFYLDDQASHSGVNAFQLVKLDDRWQIIHLMDTRRRSD